MLFYRYSTLHVIELNSSGVNGDILIHLKHFSKAEVESSKNIVVKQNLTLVLKCHVPLEWIIESSGIEGSLRVVVCILIFVYLILDLHFQKLKYYYFQRFFFFYQSIIKSNLMMLCS